MVLSARGVQLKENPYILIAKKKYSDMEKASGQRGTNHYQLSAVHLQGILTAFEQRRIPEGEDTQPGLA